MTPSCRRSSALLVLSLVLDLIVVGSAGAVQMVWLDPLTPVLLPDSGLEMEPVPPGPVMRAVDPEDQRRWNLLYGDPPSYPPPRRDREAILPDPATGRELVDQVQAEQTQVETIAVPASTVSKVPRVFQRQRLAAPGFVLPVARAT